MMQNGAAWIRRAILRVATVSIVLGSAVPGYAADPPANDMVVAQQSAMKGVEPFNGLWRGTGWSLVDGERVPETVTQRVGLALNGATQFMETRSYRADGSVAFHAFNNVAFDAENSAYVIQARAEGRFGDFPFRVTPDGYVWDLINDGRGLRYTGTLRDGVWTQVTESIAPDRSPQTIGEFQVSRVGETDWPSGGAMQPQ